MRLARTVVSVTVVALASVVPARAGQHGHAPAPQVHSHATTPAPTSTDASKTSKTTASTGTAPATTLNPIAMKISSHPQLLAKVNSLLTASGTKLTLNQASTGMKNQGQFIAALHVSQNLGLSFDALRNDMVTKNMSLGQAIQAVKHTSSTTATTQVRKAEQEADDDVKTSDTMSRTSTKPRGDDK